MGFYARYVLPRLIDLVMRTGPDISERATLVPSASGVVLEVGSGSALNLRFLGTGVKKLYGIDPSLPLWRLGRQRWRAAPVPTTFVAASGEAIPLRDAAVDTVLMTWTLCSIPDAAQALREIRRVLRPDGRLVFIEHGRAPDPAVVTWQDRLNPLWKRLSGGCHMNRQMDELIESAGFRFTRIERGYSDGPRILGYLYRGIAEPVRSAGGA